MREIKRLAAALAALVAVLAALSAAQAAVPGTVLVEGTLQATGGGAASDGAYAMMFLLYKDEAGGAPVWSEGPVDVVVKAAQFAYPLGAVTPLKPSLLPANGGWLAIKVAQDPEMARRQLHGVTTALRAGVAEGVDCSGCIQAQHIDPQFSASFAKATDLTAYVKASALADVAKSGNYEDLKGLPSLHKVASSGLAKDLKDTPLGKVCGTGLVVQGIKDDGSLVCVQGGGGTFDGKLPPDGIDEISNGLINNQFVDAVQGKTIDIPDNSPPGALEKIDFPDIGLAQKFWVNLEITGNKDIGSVTVRLSDPSSNVADETPQNFEYVLYNKGLKAGMDLKATFPDPDKALTGDLTKWYGQNPKGKWRIWVVDASYKDNQTDGQLKWSIGMQTLSNKKVQIKGDLIVDGKLIIGTQVKTDPNPATFRWNKFDYYDNSLGWAFGNDANFFAGVAPSNWNNNYLAGHIAANKDVLRTFFINKGFAAGGNAMILHENFTNYNQDSNWGRHGLFLFRIRNDTNGNVNWQPHIWHSAYGGWNDRTSVAVNGKNIWESTSNCGYCQSAPVLTIPAQKLNTVIFAVAASQYWNYWGNVGSRVHTFGFYNNSLKLPSGLAFVDDLDTATGGWEQ